jgi:hypothetical protein
MGYREGMRKIMRSVKLGLALVVSLFCAAPLFAINTGGSPVIIPVIGRFPGSGGTQWRSDLFIGNAGSPTHVVTLKFYPTGGAMQEATVTIGPFSTVTLPDVVLDTFGLANAGGTLEVSVPAPYTIQARATIYNSGNPAGIFGQAVPGIAKDYLSLQAFLYGLSGISGSRVNIGVANPNDVAADVALNVSDANNASVHSRTFTVPAHSYVQFSDIFNTFGIAPQAGLRVNFTTTGTVIYGYSSEVRNDTGDAVFNFGTSPNS